ncbi:MAG: molybdopterin converting factor subunit 1 [Gemmatimonadaceae bacterium]
MISVRVLLFASYAEALGTSSLQLELPAGSTVAELLAMVQKRAGGDRLPPRPLVAVNESYANGGDRLSTNDEVAIIPPVAGG